MEDDVSILDTTLRDGLLGRRMPLEGKLEVFRRLDQAGIYPDVPAPIGQLVSRLVEDSATVSGD